MTESNTPPAAPAETTEEHVLAPAAAPAENTGSGHFAVFSEDYGNFVSGVMNKSDAGKAKSELSKTEPTKGHKLKVLEV